MARSDPWAQFSDAPRGFLQGDPGNQSDMTAPALAPSAGAVAVASPPAILNTDQFAHFQDAPAPQGAAPITDTGMKLGFADQAPPEASKQLSPEDTAEFYRMLRGDGRPRAGADELRHFIASRGLSLDNAEQIVAARDKTGQVVGTISYPLPQPVDASTVHGAVLRGASQGASLGWGDELHGVGAGVGAALSGGDFTDAYDRTVDADRGRLAADDEQHHYATIAGDLVGSLALPFGIEKTGFTASLDAVGLQAYRAARAEGLSVRDARAVVQRAITRRLATEGSAYGGAYGAGTRNGSPGQRLVGGFVGGLEGAVGGVGLGLVGEHVAPRLYEARVAARGEPVEPMPEAIRAAQVADRQGIQLLPQDVGGAGIGRATQSTAQTPFGAKTIGAAAGRLYEGFSSRVRAFAGDAPEPIDVGETVASRAAQAADRATAAAERTSGAVQDGLAPATDSTGAGQLIQRGVSRFMDETAGRASALYDQVPIAGGQPAQLGATRQLLSDATAEWQSNPQLGAIFRNGRLSNFLSALTPETRKETTGLLDAAGAPIAREVTDGGNLSWQDLSEFRTRVGDMLADPNLTEKIAPRQLRALYGALSQDMEATAREAGPEAFAKWKRATNYYDGRMKRVRDTFSMVLGDKGDATPNEAFSAMQGMLKPGGSGNPGAFMRIMRSLPSEDANAVRATIVRDARGGRQFDPTAFARAWGQISDRGKSALLPRPGMRSMMDDAAERAAFDVRNPFAGMSGEQVFGKLQTMASSKGDAVRFARTMAGLSPDEATSVRSAFIDRLGRATPGQQNAEGSAFSIATFLTRWNSMTPEARRALFGAGELHAAMNDLATIATRVKASEKLAGHSNSGGILEGNKTNASLWAAAGALLTGHPVVAAGLAMPPVYQRLSAEVLTSPRLVRWLARVPQKADPGASKRISVGSAPLQHARRRSPPMRSDSSATCARLWPNHPVARPPVRMNPMVGRNQYSSRNRISVLSSFGTVPLTTWRDILRVAARRRIAEPLGDVSL